MIFRQGICQNEPSMKQWLLLMCVLTLAGCTAPRVSRYDEFEKVKVDKMVGNDVKFHLLTRTLVCLNAMRESRWPSPATNETVTWMTNYVVTSFTNLTVSSSSNEQLASNTNLLPAPAAPAGEKRGEGGEEAPVIIAAPAAQDTSGSGVTVSTARNESVAVAPNQRVVSQTFQRVTQLSSQATLTTNQQAVTSGTNQTLTVETNLVVTTVTNQVIQPLTNLTVVSPTQPVFDYYLYTELAPPDFPLQPGESLIVLVDGERHSFSPVQPQSGWVSRRGYLTTFYKVPPEVVVGIANANEVKLRIKGATGTLERRLSRASRQHFREFLLANFGEEKETVRLAAPKDRPS